MRASPFKAIVAVSIVLSAACGGGSGSGSPTAPTSVVPDTPDSARTITSTTYPAVNHADAVNFPPRDESYRFRLALEDFYRDRLRRQPTSSWVDPEGTVVWTQEYLRYRVNGCSHVEAVNRVLDIVEGRGTAPVCATTTRVVFPPRDEPYGFMLILDQRYATFLRRTAVSSYVDFIGNAVWTQEYLRYRATGCPHSVAQAKVFDQIEGRGVQSACDENLVGVTGVWDGVYARGGGFVLWLDGTGTPVSGRYTGDTQTINDHPVDVTASGRNFSFDLYFGDTGIRLNATWDGADTMSGTTQGQGLGPFTMRRRR